MSRIVIYLLIFIIFLTSSAFGQQNQEKTQLPIFNVFVDPSNKEDIYLRGLLKNKGKEEFFNNLDDNDYPVGKGFITKIAGEKYFITCEHVVAFAQYGKIWAEIGNKYHELEFITEHGSSDTYYDIAVLKFRDPIISQKLLHLDIQVDPLYNGKQVKIYSQNRLIKGSIVQLNSELGSNKIYYNSYLAHNVPLMKGDSGSPCLDTLNNVLGVNTRISLRDGNWKESYAIEGEIVSRVVNNIIKNNGRVPRSFLGIEFTQKKWSWNDPVQLSSFLAESPASISIPEKYIGYYINSLNCEKVENLVHLRYLLESLTPNQEVTLELCKKGLNKEFQSCEEIRLTSEKLTKKNLQKIGAHFLKKYLGRVHYYQKNGYFNVNGDFSSYDIKKKSIDGNKYYRFPLNISEISIYRGEVNENHHNNKKYRLQSLSDFGLMVQLCSIKGYIGLFGVKNQEGFKLEIEMLSDGEEIISLYL